MNVLGNVLGTDGVSNVLDAYDSSAFSIFELGSNGAGAQDVAATTLYRHGNYDYVTHGVSWDPTRSNHTLPASFYRATQPAWWPAGTRWPWVGPELSPMVGVLPAKDRSDKIQ
jgi:hypothetical protein